MKKITLISDGSLMKEKIGYSVVVCESNDANNLTVIYGNSIGNNPQKAELLGVQLGLDYCVNYAIKCKNDYKIEIITDEIIIAKFIKKMISEINDLNSRMKCNKFFNQNVQDWIRLDITCRFLGVDNINAKKIYSSDDNRHKIAHYFARRAAKEDFIKKSACYKKISGISTLNYLSINHQISLINIKGLEISDSNAIFKQRLQDEINTTKEKKVYWIGKIEGEIVYVNLKDVLLTDLIHLSTQTLDFKGKLADYANKRYIDIPIVLKPLENGKYSLVCGLVRFISAKALDINEIPAVITYLEHNDFINMYGESNSILDRKRLKV